MTNQTESNDIITPLDHLVEGPSTRTCLSRQACNARDVLRAPRRSAPLSARSDSTPDSFSPNFCPPIFRAVSLIGAFACWWLDGGLRLGALANNAVNKRADSCGDSCGFNNLKSARDRDSLSSVKTVSNKHNGLYCLHRSDMARGCLIHREFASARIALTYGC